MSEEYNRPLSEYNFGDLFTVDEFRNMCKMGAFIDYDGYGHPVRDNLVNNDEAVVPSKMNIPDDATHIIWFNR